MILRMVGLDDFSTFLLLLNLVGAQKKREFFFLFIDFFLSIPGRAPGRMLTKRKRRRRRR